MIKSSSRVTRLDNDQKIALYVLMVTHIVTHKSDNHFCMLVITVRVPLFSELS